MLRKVSAQICHQNNLKALVPGQKLVLKNSKLFIVTNEALVVLVDL
jgi:hypothetical protein